YLRMTTAISWLSIFNPASDASWYWLVANDPGDGSVSQVLDSGSSWRLPFTIDGDCNRTGCGLQLGARVPDRYNATGHGQHWGEGAIMIKQLSLLKAKPGMARDTFIKRYEEIHAPL